LETNHVSDSRGSLYPDGCSRALRSFRVELDELEVGLHHRRGLATQGPLGSGSLRQRRREVPTVADEDCRQLHRELIDQFGFDGGFHVRAVLMLVLAEFDQYV
jgi:hypothetical protein